MQQENASYWKKYTALSFEITTNPTEDKANQWKKEPRFLAN